MEDKERIQILYTKHCERFVKPVSDALAQFYHLRTYENNILSLIPSAYNTQRKQYSANSLIEYMTRSKRGRIALWLVDQDIYTRELDYVFGCASRDYGAVVSTFRLKKDEQVLKEAMHEVGHILGFKHCNGRCYMRSSLTVEDVEMKPYRLCDNCKDLMPVSTKKQANQNPAVYSGNQGRTNLS
jgi:archaemetzincin